MNRFPIVIVQTKYTKVYFFFLFKRMDFTVQLTEWEILIGKRIKVLATI